MNLRQLEQELDRSLDLYHKEVLSIIDSFHSMNKQEKERMLSETLDDMNRQSFYTFLEYKDNIIKYLKGLDK